MTGNVCPRRGERTVTLYDGASVSSWSPEWMRECQARGILRMPTRTARRDYLEQWERKHGKASRDELERLVMAVWRAGKCAKDYGDK